MVMTVAILKYWHVRVYRCVWCRACRVCTCSCACDSTAKQSSSCRSQAPCLNGGQCLFESNAVTGHRLYKCNCMAGYTGDRCQTCKSGFNSTFNTRAVLHKVLNRPDTSAGLVRTLFAFHSSSIYPSRSGHAAEVPLALPEHCKLLVCRLVFLASDHPTCHC